MTVSAQTVYPVWKVTPKQSEVKVRERLPWMACPRCIGGMMYPESKREHVCIQCGHRAYHHKIPDRTMTEGFHLGMK